MVKKTRRTAEEFMADLEADPAFRAQRERAHVESEAFAAQLRVAQKPLLKELAEIGFTLDTVEDLATFAKPYPAAIPILLEHLRRPYPPLVLQGIARALAVPEARIAWPILADIFRELPTDPEKGGLKFAVGYALAEAVDDSVMDDLAGLLLDRRHGQDRLALLGPFIKRRTPADRELLSALSSDPDLRREIRRQLGRPKRGQSSG